MVFHVFNRGFGRRNLFDKADDFEAFERRAYALVGAKVTASFLAHGPCLDRRTGLTWSTSRRRRRNDKPCAIAYSGERHLATKIGPRQLLVGSGLRRPDNRVAVPERPPMAAKREPSIPSFSKFGTCQLIATLVPRRRKRSSQPVIVKVGSAVWKAVIGNRWRKFGVCECLKHWCLRGRSGCRASCAQAACRSRADRRGRESFSGEPLSIPETVSPKMTPDPFRSVRFVVPLARLRNTADLRERHGTSRRWDA